ncbi:MAG: hypothetical protein C5B50_20645 [Verrucomicrobia bacterium]|nr:MAG: hypothetical protein C5B50_20645 [Verrucomicrobiota bacterium]
MIDTTSLRYFLEQKLPPTLDLLRQMVAINSFTGNPEGVNHLARLTAETFAPFGFSAEFVPSTNPLWGNHLVLTRRGRSTRSLALIAHLDTVFPPEEEARNNFVWQQEGDRIFGPGTHDIKGGTAMMWLVLTALQAQARELFEDITWKLIWNSSEECFSPDFSDLCKQNFDKETVAALIFEAEGRAERPQTTDHRPQTTEQRTEDGAQRSAVRDQRSMVSGQWSDFRVQGSGFRNQLPRGLVVARKGRATWRVSVSGRGAHAGGKHPYGANAVVELGHIVQRIAALTDYSKNLTVNVASVSGGTGLNRVPHAAIAEGEFRAFTPEAFETGRRGLLSLAGPGEVRSVADGHACQVQVEILTESSPWPRNAGTDRLFGVWQKTGEDLELPVFAEERGGLSDGNGIWDAVPTLDGLGPWGDNDHCSERSPDGSKLPEYVEISSFVPKAVLNVMAIKRLLSGMEG